MVVLVLLSSLILLDKYSKQSTYIKNDETIFAQLDENNVVTQVIVVGNSDTADVNGVESENIGVAFCQSLLGAETNWKTDLL